MLACALGACGTEPTPDPPDFPADYLATYTEVRDCRNSIEHGAVRIRVLAAPDALAAYTGRQAPFPTGALLLKEEYDSSDLSCAGPIRFWTTMEKLDVGTATPTLDWHWQKVDATRRVTEQDDGQVHLVPHRVQRQRRVRLRLHVHGSLIGRPAYPRRPIETGRV